MRMILLAGAMLVAALPAAAEPPVEAPVPRSVALFYDGLNAAPGKDAAALLRQATAPGWLSCDFNTVCEPRDEVIARIAAHLEAIPDLRWEIKDVIVAGNRVVVRGEATGTPSGDFLGVPHEGGSFRVMSIDVHTLDGDRLTRSYHVENWLGAARQLSGQEPFPR